MHWLIDFEAMPMGGRWILLVFAFVGIWSFSRLVMGLSRVVFVNHMLTGVNIKRKYASKGHYVLITGATDGIGLEFATQFAKIGMNVVLVSRTESKLKDTAANIMRECPDVDVQYKAIDFSRVSERDYDALSELARQLPISILVNNVAMNHSIPTPFIEENQQVIDNIINVNIAATLRVTRCMLPPMVERKEGVVINIGSFAGAVPTPFLQTYSGSKAFLKNWSIALGAELAPQGVHVEHLNTYFVVSNMSKISRPSVLIPTAHSYVKQAIKKCGKMFDITPYPTHNLLAWVFETMVSPTLLLKQTYDLQVNIRKRALKKMEKLAKAQ